MSKLRELIPRLPRDAWVVLGADALSAAGTGLTMPFLLVYLHSVRGIPFAVAGLAVSMVAGGSVAGNLAGGTLADRVGARNALILGLAVAAAGAALLTLVTAPWHAFAATAVAGVGAGIVWPAQDALLAGVVAPSQRSTVFSVRMASMNAGLGVGALAVAAVVDAASAHGFVVLYLLDAISFLAVIPLLVTVAAPARSQAVNHTQRPAGSYRQVIGDKTFLRVWGLTALVVALSYGQLHSAFPAYATGPGGIPASALGLAYAANTITVVIAQLLVLRTMRGRRRTSGILAACTGWATAWMLTLLAGHLGDGGSATAAFVLALVVFGLAETFASPTLTPIVNDLAPASLTGRYNGLYTLAWTGGFLTGTAIAGVSLSAGQGSALFVALIAGCALAAVATLRLKDHLPARANTIAA
jgi:MFS family permease